MTFLFINKIPASSSIELHCSAPGREPLVFNVEAVLGSQSRDKTPLLYCTPVVINGKLINLKGLTIDAYILNRGDHRRYYFNINDVGNVKNPRQTGSLLLLFSSTDAKPLNYRRAARIPCNVPCTVHFGGTIDNVSCRLKDLSSCGIAFVVPKTSQPVMGSTAEVTFTVPDFSMSYKLQSVVVRLQDVSDTEVLVGCDLTDYYPNLVALCNHLKQTLKSK